MAIKSTRHSWVKKINHPYCHVYTCIKCGCVKDATAMLCVKYILPNGVVEFKAPKCETK